MKTKNKIKEFSFVDLYKCIVSFFRERPFITTLIIFLFFLSNISEAIGISALLLILLEFFNIQTSQNNISLYLNNFFEFFNISNNLNSMLFVFFIAIVLKSVILFGSLYISAIAGVNISRIARKNLIKILMSARYSFLINIPIGKIITHLNDEADRIAIFYVKFCRSINYLSQALVYSLLALLTSIQLTFLLISFALITAFLLQLFNKIFYNIGQEALIIKRSFNNNISNLFSSIKLFKVMGLENFGSESIQSDVNRIKKNISKYWFFESMLISIQEPLSFIFIVIFIVCSILFFNIPPVTVLFVAAVFYRLSNRLLSFYNSLRGLVNFLPSVNSIKEIGLVAKKEKEYFKGKEKINDINHISFKNLNFSYKKNVIFKNLSINLDLKKIIFISGKSGVGKTTFVDLISGLYTPSKGFIKLNNKKLENIDLVNWRNQIGYVSQDPQLFNDTIINNLCLMKKCEKDEMNKILKITYCSDFINKFDRKLDTIIGSSGSKISGGQRERLAIARALLQKPKLLILDEATSEMNNTLEEKILTNIIKLKDLMGIIIISHNKKNKKFANQIFEISNNKIIKNT